MAAGVAHWADVRLAAPALVGVSLDGAVKPTGGKAGWTPQKTRVGLPVLNMSEWREAVYEGYVIAQSYDKGSPVVIR